MPASIVITNDTPIVQTISGIKIRGSDSTDFIEATDCGYTIEVGAGTL